MEPAEPEKPKRAPRKSQLVRELEKELSAVDRLDTFDGQFALSLAEQMTAVGASGVAGLAKELRAARTAALAGTTPPGQDVPEDAVARARRLKAEKAAALQAAAG